MGAGYTVESLAAGAEELRRKLIEATKQQAAIPPGKDADLSWQQREDLAMIEGWFASVPTMFVPFLDMPKPEDFLRLAEVLKVGANRLMTVQNSPDPARAPSGNRNDQFSRVETAGDILQDWTGDAAREFKANYLDKLPFQLAGQFNVIVLCAELIGQEQVIWREAATSIASILNRGIDSVDQLISGCGNKAKWTVVLTAVAGLATIASAPAGIALATVLATVDATASVGTTLLRDDPPKELTYSAATALEVFLAVNDAVVALIRQIYEQEQRIKQVFDQAGYVIAAERHRFVPAAPLLVTQAGMPVQSRDYLGFTT